MKQSVRNTLAMAHSTEEICLRSASMVRCALASAGRWAPPLAPAAAPSAFFSELSSTAELDRRRVEKVEREASEREVGGWMSGPCIDREEQRLQEQRGHAWVSRGCGVVLSNIPQGETPPNWIWCVNFGGEARPAIAAGVALHRPDRRVRGACGTAPGG